MDCTAKCRLYFHADVVLSAVTQENLENLQHFVKYFCGNGAKARDIYGRNALHIAASCGRKDVLKWLLEEKVLDIHEKDFESGWTPLHRACYYGHLSCALLLIQHGANIYERDFEGLSPVEILMLDCPGLSDTLSQAKSFDVYSWGRNSNFTLGHGDDKERNTPEILDVFARMLHISVQKVVLCKFHAVFLTDSGNIWTCGHGLGGRLGHGDEKTILVPKKVDSLSGNVCIDISADQDHTVALCENGNVFTFGLNKYHQVGHHPPSEQYLTPKQVLNKTLKGKKFIGIACGKFHTLMFTETEVYSCGLNAGQLGHIKGDKTQIIPRQISGLHLKDTSILSISCSDAATVCLTNHGDVYLAYQYTLRKIITKLPNIKKLVVTGGHLDETNSKELQNMKSGHLTIYGLYGDGYVFIWKEGDKYLRDCHWTIQKPLSIQDIAYGRHLNIVTDNGEVFTEDGGCRSLKKPLKYSLRNENVIKTNNAFKQDEVLEISLSRVCHAHRAVRIVCDKSSQNFAILQSPPSSGCSAFPPISPPEMMDNLKSLFEDIAQSYDLEIKVKDKTIYAHKVVVAEASDKLITMINHTSNEDSNIDIIYLNDENYETMNEIIEFLYTGSCASLPQLNLKNSERVHDERELTDEDILDALAMSLQDVDFDFLDLPVDCKPAKKDKKSTRSKKSRKNGENQYIDNTMMEQYSGDMSGKRKELLRVAKKYRINELIVRIQDIPSGDINLRKKIFHRNKLLKYCDVMLEAEDNVQFSCHKCILVSRLEYFRAMLTTGWMESCEEYVHLKMPIPSRLLKVIIEFLYTDDAPSVKDSKDLEFLGKVLTLADQFWIIRLRELCETRLASLISLKNAIEMLEFSCLYNAEKLKHICLEFICMNISCLFEAGSLEMLSEDVLEEVSEAYRKVIPRVSWRLMTPNNIHLSVPWPHPESPSKRKSSRSQRKSRTSECDVTEESAMQENGTDRNEFTEEKIVDIKMPRSEEMNGDQHIESCSVEGESIISDSTLKDLKTQNTKQNGLSYEKPGNECEDVVSSSKTTQKQITRASPLPIEPRKNNGSLDEKQPWGSPSFSPQSSSLRDIMEQEQSQKNLQLNKPRKEGKSPQSGKTRISQKERKKMIRYLEEQDSLDINTTECDQNESDVLPVNPWNNSSSFVRPSVSFKDLLEEEEGLVKSVSISRKKNKIVKENVSQVDEKPQSTSAWQHSIAKSPPQNSYMNFDKIQQLQEQETANRERDMKKPLSLIQIEDKAMEQLIEYYGGRYNPCEYILVKRETRKTGSPNWVK